MPLSYKYIIISITYNFIKPSFFPKVSHGIVLILPLLTQSSSSIFFSHHDLLNKNSIVHPYASSKIPAQSFEE
jgi:hypothetical protein